jgi:hypothetical protein
MLSVVQRLMREIMGLVGRRVRPPTGVFLTATALVIVSLTAPASASANGPCGQDFDGNHSCPVNSAVTSSYPGSLITDNETDYYVFHAVRGTELSVSITDTEDPRCSTSYAGNCGDINAALDDAQGNGVDGTDGSQPSDGITVPQTFSHTLEATGTYFLLISGNLGTDANDNPTAVPYTLSVNAAPSVQWPPPAAPPAIVPRLMWKGKSRPRHKTFFSLAAYNSSGSAIATGVTAIVQIYVHHRWTVRKTVSEPFNFYVGWSRSMRSHWWSVRVVASGAGYRTGYSNIVRVKAL